MPINTTRATRDCIVQDGVRYCEKKDMTRKEIGLLSFSIIAIILWIALWVWIGVVIEDRYGIFGFPIAISGTILLPLLVIGIICLLF